MELTVCIQKEAVKKQVIDSKYGKEEDGWHFCEVRDVYEVGIWKAIKEWDLFNSKYSFFFSFLFFMANGRKVKFWKDKWCGEESLCVSFPSLYALTISKETWVIDFEDQTYEVGHWSLVSLGLWISQLDIVELFFSRLQGKSVNREWEDRVVWMDSRNGTLHVKALYSTYNQAV